MTRNATVLFNKVPEGYPLAGETLKYDPSGTIDLENVSLNGGTLLKVLAFSVDPYMRGRMRDPSIKSYSPAYIVGEPITAYGVAAVLRSEHPDYKQGDHIYATLPFQEYVVAPASNPLVILPSDGRIPWEQYLGVAGMPGRTAWIGYKAFAKPKKGETIYVNTAAGAVGTIVCQLAKADGLKVIGSAGSDDKVRYLKEIGVDHAFNYKTTSVKEALKEYGPLDIFWDHVGGEQFEAALDTINVFGRIISVGWSSGYNAKEQYPVNNLSNILTKTLSVNGLIVGYLAAKIGDYDFYKVVPKMVHNGEFKFKEYVKEGMERTEELFLDVLHGRNDGKAILRVADS